MIINFLIIIQVEIMKKLTGEFRLRRMLVIGIAIGLVAGVLCTGVAAKSVLSKNKAEFAAEKEKLKKKTNQKSIVSELY